MHELFIIGSIPFALLLVAEFIALWICISAESGLSATITMVVTAVMLGIFGNFKGTEIKL